MKLIVGGAFQGKTAFVEEQLQPEIALVDGHTCSREELFACQGVNYFHEYIKRMLRKGENVADLARELAAHNPDCVVIIDDLGCGVVPIDSFERLYREQNGRVCTALATEATMVYRVVCGIGQVIKDA